MASPDNALQAAIYTRLTGYSALTSALGGVKVYDHVPQGTSAPYVVIGDNTLSEWDTKSRNGWNCTIAIHVWDYLKAGRKSVNTLLSHIYDALHRQEANLTLTGFSLVEISREFHEAFQDTTPEGASDHFYHGVCRFRALITT